MARRHDIAASACRIAAAGAARPATKTQTASKTAKTV